MSQEKQSRVIAIIEDDIDIQDLLSAFLKPKGYTLVFFSSAEAALLELEENQKCDVIITDLQLPKMNGIEFIQKFNSMEKQVPIIVMTVTKSADVAIQAVKQGAYDFIVKPIHFPQLLLSIERALQLKTLKEDFQFLRSIIKKKDPSEGIIGRSQNFLNAISIAKKVAKSTANILVTGESGTGKELIAKLLHTESYRSKGPFVAINCSAIPENLLESELFGFAKGSFTGAVDKKIGLFEEAENGTIFLDEIGDLSLPMQAKILRVLQEKKIKRIGENQARMINARVVSATHKNLAEEISAGRFREDLFFRLNVIPIKIPPLRDRKEDIVPMAEYFLTRFALVNDSPVRAFSKDALEYLLDQKWKGNVRELENAIERAVVLTESTVIQVEDLYTEELRAVMANDKTATFDKNDFHIPFEHTLLPLHDVVQKYIEYAVMKNEGAKDKTAKELQIDRKTLYRKINPTENSLN